MMFTTATVARRTLAAALVLLAATGAAQAQSFCDATYHFDGNLADSSGNGYAGTAFGRDNQPAEPQFGEGISGQALLFDGATGIYTDLDLHFDGCPRVTITGWLRLNTDAPAGANFIMSAGDWGPHGVSVFERSIVLRGSGSGLQIKDALRDERAWFFFAGVYDFDAGTHRLRFRNRTVERALPETVREPAGETFFGARDERLTSPAKDIFLDEVRIFGRALSDDEISQVAAEISSRPWLTAVAHQATRIQQVEQSGAISPPGRTASDIRGPIDGPGAAERIANANVGPLGEARTSGGLQRPPGETDPAIAAVVRERREGTAPLDLGYDSEEEARAAAEERSAREREERAATAAPSTIPTLQYDASILVHSGVSGGAGDRTRRAVFTQSQGFLTWIETRENFDKPCTVYVFSHPHRALIAGLPASAMEFDVCDEGLPRINPLTTLHRAVNEPEVRQAKLITGLQVCNNGINNRVKGIRARVQTAEYPSGNHSSSYETVTFEERSNCLNWRPFVTCDANTFAVGVTLHFRDGDVVSPRDFLSGIELACTAVHWEDLPPLL